MDKKIFKIWNEKKEDYMTVDEDWMYGVNTKGASEFVFNGTDRLFVTYSKDSQYERHVCYELVFSNWGFPQHLAF